MERYACMVLLTARLPHGKCSRFTVHGLRTRRVRLSQRHTIHPLGICPNDSATQFFFLFPYLYARRTVPALAYSGEEGGS